MEDVLRHYENKEQMGMYMREHQDIAWSDLAFWDKAKLFNKYAFVTIIGNIL
jgi:hypothetical protein